MGSKTTAARKVVSSLTLIGLIGSDWRSYSNWFSGLCHVTKMSLVVKETQGHA